MLFNGSAGSITELSPLFRLNFLTRATMGVFSSFLGSSRYLNHLRTKPLDVRAMPQPIEIDLQPATYLRRTLQLRTMNVKYVC